MNVGMPQSNFQNVNQIKYRMIPISQPHNNSLESMQVNNKRYRLQLVQEYGSIPGDHPNITNSKS
jgi:hypothetical protein